jgi:hypothetical protein
MCSPVELARLPRGAGEERVLRGSRGSSPQMVSVFIGEVLMSVYIGEVPEVVCVYIGEVLIG